MINIIKSILILLFLSQNTVFSQVVDLGSISDYVFFTSAGNITNTGTDTITGDVGSNFGSISMLGATHTGNVNIPSLSTAQTKVDLINLYQQLTCVRNTDSTRAPVFGFDETLNPGVYSIDTAGSLADTIILDGLGDANALFIIKFAGAFKIAANSTVILANDAQACNVFWITADTCLIGASTILVVTSREDY